MGSSLVTLGFVSVHPWLPMTIQECQISWRVFSAQKENHCFGTRHFVKSWIMMQPISSTLKFTLNILLCTYATTAKEMHFRLSPCMVYFLLGLINTEVAAGILLCCKKLHC